MIATIRGMRKLSKEYRIQLDSLAEIRHELDRLAFVFRDVRVGTRKASEGHVANAALLLLLAMEPAERERAVGLGLERLHALLTMDEATPEAVRAIVEGRADRRENPAHGGPGLRGVTVVDVPEPPLKSAARPVGEGGGVPPEALKGRGK
jgi:hypothetical protein